MFERRQLRHEARDQLRRAETVDHPGDHIVDGKVRGRARAAGRQGLENQRRVEAAHPRATALLAHIDCAHAERGSFTELVDGKVFLLVPFDGVRRKTVVGEFFREIADGELIGREFEHEHAYPNELGRKKASYRELEPWRIKTQRFV
jgi:hypothetical protein